MNQTEETYVLHDVSKVTLLECDGAKPILADIKNVRDENDNELHPDTTMKFATGAISSHDWKADNASQQKEVEEAVAQEALAYRRRRAGPGLMDSTSMSTDEWNKYVKEKTQEDNEIRARYSPESYHEFLRKRDMGDSEPALKKFKKAFKGQAPKLVLKYSSHGKKSSQ